MLDSAISLGFSVESEARDRCQLQFLAQLMRRGATRFVLKGGMAMRALYGSARLTKDIDFDCEDSVSAQSMKTQMPKALEQAARSMSFDVEVSRRGVPGDEYVTTRTVQAPYEYRLSAFVVRVYTAEAMAAAKVNALLSENRNVPRDIYDLHDLVQLRVDPSPLWIAYLPREVLQRKRDAVWAKIDGIKFDQAFDELLPYIPPSIRDTIDAPRWDLMRTNVAAQVDLWLEAAVAAAKPALEMNRDPKSDADLAGR